MIGRLTLPVTDPSQPAGFDTSLRATLDDDLCWHCHDPEWATLLSARFPAPAVVTDPRTTGRFLLYRAAEQLSARVEIAGRATATA